MQIAVECRLQVLQVYGSCNCQTHPNLESVIIHTRHDFQKNIPILSGWWFEPLWKIWKSIGMIIPNIWENKKWQPNHQPVMFLQHLDFQSSPQPQPPPRCLKKKNRSPRAHRRRRHRTVHHPRVRARVGFAWHRSVQISRIWRCPKLSRIWRFPKVS